MTQRIQLANEDQRRWFNEIKTVSRLSWDDLGSIVGVTGRTVRDWARGRYTISYEMAKKLSHTYSVPLPPHAVVDQFWHIPKAAKLGGVARFQKYGPPGNKASRKKGGLISQQNRHADPEKYRLLGCKVEKPTPKLVRSEGLAELCGIILGDGAITHGQVRITLNKVTDQLYATYVSGLIRDMFNETPSVAYRKNVVTLTVSGVNIVKSLEGIGLHHGNKVRQQVQIPRWVLNNKKYAKACTRGLIDTDGGVYYHKHSIKGTEYTHLGLSLSNHSLPIIQGVATVLKSFRFTPSVMNQKKIYIYKLSEVVRYFKTIGTSNPKHAQRLHHYLKLTAKSAMLH